MILKTQYFEQYNSITAKSRFYKCSITTLTKTVDNKFNLLLLYINLLYLNKFIKTAKSCYTVIVALNLLIFSKLHYNKGLLYSCYTVILRFIMQKDEDLVKAFKMLDGLLPGEILDITRLAKERQLVFTSCAKQYADTHHNITFNNDYTKIRKDERI